MRKGIAITRSIEQRLIEGVGIRADPARVFVTVDV
jgi:hypothetical protein